MTSTSVNTPLAATETVGAMYGFKLKKSKCDLVRLSGSSRVRFRDNTLITIESEATCLGCWLNNRGEPARETKTRMDQTFDI
eukprot:3031529-Karenia_brevis.AAC.1